MAAGQKQSYTYDRFGNLRTITTGTTTARLGADAATNRLSQSTIGGQSQNAFSTYDAAGQLTSWNHAGGTFTYDGLGMIATSTSVRYIYTPSEERLVSMAVSGATEVSSEWTLRDISGKVLRRLTRANGTWTWRQDYIYLNASLLAAEVDTPAKTLHFFPDHLGTPRLITGNGGAQIGFHTYFPFGEEVTSSAQDAERLKFTGHERDGSGLDYMHARYYSAGVGRFLSIDPAQVREPTKSQLWNRYTYVRNNPITAIDPDGAAEIRIPPPPPETVARWSPEQIAAESMKNAQRADALARGQELVVTKVTGPSILRRLWERAFGPVPAGYHVDHIIDRQLGGPDHLTNAQLLDDSVNPSNGVRTARALKGLSPGTRITNLSSTVLLWAGTATIGVDIVLYRSEFRKKYGREPTLGETAYYLQTRDVRSAEDIERQWWENAAKQKPDA